VGKSHQVSAKSEVLSDGCAWHFPCLLFFVDAYILQGVCVCVCVCVCVYAHVYGGWRPEVGKCLPQSFLPFILIF
jgi:hypothetical protein